MQLLRSIPRYHERTKPFPERRCLPRIAVARAAPPILTRSAFRNQSLLTLRSLLVAQVVNHGRPARRGCGAGRTMTVTQTLDGTRAADTRAVTAAPSFPGRALPPILSRSNFKFHCSVVTIAALELRSRPVLRYESESFQVSIELANLTRQLSRVLTWQT